MIGIGPKRSGGGPLTIDGVLRLTFPLRAYKKDLLTLAPLLRPPQDPLGTSKGPLLFMIFPGKLDWIPVNT